ncbi:hypothetical protein AB0F72_09370 [Actinoplanes sp. NPDC023936]|uniref:hypothetical protein n=1 Tax=Actinoplanes sp. NPDC023936 TaxID=3154910 RepID=UPI0033F8B692
MMRWWRALVAWLRDRRAKRDRHDDLRVLRALTMHRTSSGEMVPATDGIVAWFAGIPLHRAVGSLSRLVADGQVLRIWDDRDGRLRYRITGSRLMGVER